MTDPSPVLSAVDAAEQAVTQLVLTWLTLTPSQRERCPAPVRREMAELVHRRRQANLPPLGYRTVPIDAATRPALGERLDGRIWIELPGRGLLFRAEEPQCALYEVDIDPVLAIVQRAHPSAQLTEVPTVYLESCRRWLALGPASS